MATVRVRESELSYSFHGRSGDPTVLMHGSLEDRSTFSRVIPGFASSLHVLAYDRRGYGESRGPPTDHRVREDADDLAELLAAEDFYPVHLVAHSYAGAVALRLSVDRPELVRSLSLHEPPFYGLLRDEPDTLPDAERIDTEVIEVRRRIAAGDRDGAAEILVNAFAGEPAQWGRLPTAARSTLLRYLDQWTEEFRDPEAARPSPAELHDLLLPVLLTVGDQSPRFVHRIVGRLDGLLRNSVVQTLREAGHSPQVGSPDQYVGQVVTFLLERNVPST